MLSKEEFRMFVEDLREKAAAKPKIAVGKKRPRQLITPSSFKELTPWWKAAPDILWVNILTGQVIVNRWPLE